MRNAVKAEIVKSEKSFHKDGYLTLKLSGDNHEEVKNFVRLRKLGPGSVVQISINDKESKSSKQLRAIHGLIRCYDIFLQEMVEGYVDINDLKNTIKYRYGVIEYWEHDGKTLATLKSFAEYTMEEMRPVIDGIMDEMDKNFMEYDYKGPNADKYIKIKDTMRNNSQEIKNDADELF